MRKSKKILSVTLALIMALSTLVAGSSAVTANAAATPVKVTLVSTAYNTNATVTLGWTAASGASGYQIAKKRITDKGYTYLTVTGTSYNDKKVIAGTIYYYQIRAFYKSGKNINYGAWSNTKPITTLYRPTVTGLNYIDNNVLMIDWNKILGVTHYKLAFKRATDKAWNYRDVKSTCYNVPNATRGARYYIQVCPMNGKLAGQWSAVNSKMIGLYFYKPTITSVHIADCDNDCIQINWAFPFKCDGCEIYVRKATDDCWDSLRNYGDSFDGDGSEELDMEFWGIEPGYTYYFQVRAVMDDFRNFAFSKFSNVYSFYVPEVQKS